MRQALAAVWRDVRSGIVPASDGARLAFMATALQKLLEAEDFERRLTALEQRYVDGRMDNTARTH